jgi:hypothetical protein
MLRLKAIGNDQDYPPGLCAASRCKERASVVDATFLLSKRQVPLCEHHWQMRCELEPDEPEEMIIDIVERCPTQARPVRAARRRRPRVDERQLPLPLD